MYENFLMKSFSYITPMKLYKLAAWSREQGREGPEPRGQGAKSVGQTKPQEWKLLRGRSYKGSSATPHPPQPSCRVEKHSLQGSTLEMRAEPPAGGWTDSKG